MRFSRKTSALVAALLITIAAPPAASHADEASPPMHEADSARGGFDVTLAARGVRIRSGACQDVPFVVRHNGGYLDRFTAEVEVWRGRRFVQQTFDYVYDSSGPLRGSFYHCAYDGDDLGTFRLGPTSGEYNDYDAGIDREYSDSTKTFMKVLQHSRFASVRITRARSTRTVTAILSYFDVGASAYRRAPRGVRIRLQRQTARGSWKTIEAGRIRERGLVSISFNAPRRQAYRLVSSETEYTWSATSAVARR